METTYKTCSGHSFTTSLITPTIVFTESDLDNIDPGKLVTDADGAKFVIAEMRHLTGRLYRVSLIPA